jgi:hypothetical protein
MTSKASAKDWIQIASVPDNVRLYFDKAWATSISGAPPPAINALDMVRRCWGDEGG